MRHKLFQLATAALLVAAAAASARADLRIKQRMSVSGQSIESEVAIKGQRQRTEQQIVPGMKSVSIMQCDLKRMLNIGEAARKYTVTPLGGEADDAAAKTPPPAAAKKPAPAAARRGGLVTYVMTLTDTGERKQMLGYTARRIKTVMRSEPSPDACQKEPFHLETDGWYIDFDFNFSCLTQPQTAGASYAGAQGECQDRVRYRHVGAAKLGYPAHVTTTFYKDGQPQFTSTTEVVSITRATLDAALFDVPAGYTEARNAGELYDTSAMMAAARAQAGAGDDDDKSKEAGREPNNESAGAAAMSAAAAGGGAKRAGVVRIGVIPPANKTDKSVGIDALRGGLIASLTGGNVEAVALEATSPGGLEAEAKSKECDFLLYTDIVSVKQSAASKLGGFMSRATGAADAKEKYEAKIEFSLVPVGASAPLLEASAAAKEDGAPDAALAAALRREAQLVLAKIRK